MNQHKNHLNHSYQLDSIDDTQDFYSDWAKTYDAEIIDNGYASPQRCADALAKYCDNKSIKLLDIGCGTGLSGKILTETGFTQIDGCDINPEMLAIAKSRGVYQNTWLSKVDKPFPFETGKYDAISAIGVIGAGAAPLSLFHDTLEILNQGCLFVFSFNDHTLEDLSYENAVKSGIKNKQFELLFKKYGDHLPGRNIKSNVYVLRKL